MPLLPTGNASGAPLLAGATATTTLLTTPQPAKAAARPHTGSANRRS